MNEKIEKILENSEKEIENLKKVIEKDLDDGEEKEKIYTPFFEADGVLYQQVFDPEKSETYFISFDGKKYEKLYYVELEDKLIFPNSLEFLPRKRSPLVNLAEKPEDYVSVPHLIEKIEKFIYKYGDISDWNRHLSAMFGVLTWIYDKMDAVPYLRFLADTGKGKTRLLKIMREVCYNSFLVAGCSTLSGALRLQSKWRGTALFNETDFKNSEDTSLFIKWVNNGFEKDLPIVMSNKENPNRRDVFDPFGPKIFAMKRPFDDPATESRLISIDMYETRRADIPILLDEQFLKEGLALRNMLLDFRFKNWNSITSVPEDAVMAIRQLDVEPRLKQIMLPFLPIVVCYKGGLDKFINFIEERQKEIRKQRASSWEGTVFNILYAIATGDDQYEECFGDYRNRNNQISIITTRMIAEELKTSPKSVATTLKSIGFDIEPRYVEVRRRRKLEDGSYQERFEKRVIRGIVIQDRRRWEEAVRRYYIDYAESVPDIPDCLKGQRFIDDNILSSIKSVKSVKNVKNEEQNTFTDFTDFTHFIEDKQNPFTPEERYLLRKIEETHDINEAKLYLTEVLKVSEKKAEKIVKNLADRGVISEVKPGHYIVNTKL